MGHTAIQESQHRGENKLHGVERTLVRNAQWHRGEAKNWMLRQERSKQNHTALKNVVKVATMFEYVANQNIS